MGEERRHRRAYTTCSNERRDGRGRESMERVVATENLAKMNGLLSYRDFMHPVFLSTILKTISGHCHRCEHIRGGGAKISAFLCG
jgi:hypothetical protein